MRRILSLIALLVTAMVIEPATAATPTFSGCGILRLLLLNSELLGHQCVRDNKRD